MAYDIDEFEQSGVVETEAAAAKASATEAANTAKAADDAAKKEKDTLQSEIKDLKSKYETVNNEFSSFKKRLSGDDGKDVKADPYDALRARGVKDEELKGFDALQEAWFQKRFGVAPDEFTKRYNTTANSATGASVITAELNYDRAKSKIFDDIQRSNSEIRPDYFMNRLEELEAQMKPEVLAAIKSLPPDQLIKTLKATYYNEIGEVKADKDGIARYKKFQDEAGDMSKKDKIDSSNKGGWSSNIARNLKESDFEKKGMTLQESVNSDLFS